MKEGKMVKASDQGNGSGATKLPHLEDSPSYNVLRDQGLITSEYRKQGIAQIDLVAANSNNEKNFQVGCMANVLLPCVGGAVLNYFRTLFVVPPNHVQKLINKENSYLFAGPGVHNIGGTFVKRVGSPQQLRGHIQHGDRNILVVEQGFVGLAWDNGQPLLLPPGIHDWKSDTLYFQKYVELKDHVIRLGPYTLLTVDEGYAAVTQNNGKQDILGGGSVYLLNHRNWKFEKFITLKIQTDNLERIKATSADNVIMSVTSTVNWKIVDVEVVAKMAAETMSSNSGGSETGYGDITKLRNDVLKQAVASLASFIGSVNYSDSFHLAAAIQSGSHQAVQGVPLGGSAEDSHDKSRDNPLFDMSAMKNAVMHANRVTRTYGVEIISINIISADPVDNKLEQALALGAVAAAEALQMETAARGKAKAVKIEAEATAMASKISASGEAESTVITAKAEADADRIRAQGSKDAANLLEQSKVAVMLAQMDKTGDILGPKDKYFFSQDASYLSKIILSGDQMKDNAAASVV